MAGHSNICPIVTGPRRPHLLGPQAFCDTDRGAKEPCALTWKLGRDTPHAEVTGRRATASNSLRSRIHPQLGNHKTLQQLAVRGVSRDTGGSNIGAFAEMEDEVFPFFVDELNIGEVNVETADLQEVHTVLSEPAFNARI